jgi:hypothetical protein
MTLDHDKLRSAMAGELPDDAKVEIGTMHELLDDGSLCVRGEWLEDGQLHAVMVTLTPDMPWFDDPPAVYGYVTMATESYLLRLRGT